MELKPIRAKAHREFLAPKFGGTDAGTDPEGLTFAEIMANPKTAALGIEVYAMLREQFAEGAAHVPGTSEGQEYRTRLANWADILEVLLEETIAEIERIDNRLDDPLPGLAG